LVTLDKFIIKMILKSFSYKDLEHSVHKFMELDTIPFNHINLIVGRNRI